jgi:type I restriction enzyme S subunit
MPKPEKTEFKDTEIGRIPREWEVVKLGEVLSLRNGERPSASENGIFPIYGANGIMGYTLKFLVDNDFTIVIGRVGASGEVHIGTGKIWISDNAIYSENYNRNKVYMFFIYHLLKFKKISQFASKSTHPIITQSFLNYFLVPLPPLPEQQKIAEILSTVDEAIEKVDEAIAKTERLKKGLMQELLTKGIGHKEFKDTEIGRIPTEWEVVKLGDEQIAEIRGNKSINGFDEIAFIPMEAVPDSGIFVTFEIRSMEEVKSFTYCENGDLLLAKITPSLENGKQGIVPDNIPHGFALATTEVFPIKCKGIEKLFLFYVLKDSRYRNKIIASMIGTTGRQRATKVSVKNLLIPLPPLPEQKKIAEILSTVDKRLELLRNKKERLARIKKGLMDDLLTGRRRVKL